MNFINYEIILYFIVISKKVDMSSFFEITIVRKKFLMYNIHNE